MSFNISGAIRTGAQTFTDFFKGKGLHLRSSQWHKVREEHLKVEPFCQWCSGKEKLEVHHVIPFSEVPSLELDHKNLITLCEAKPQKCHLIRGHKGNYKKSNTNIVKECANNRKEGNRRR